MLIHSARSRGWSGIDDNGSGSGSGGARTGAELNIEAARQSVVMLKRGSLPWPTAKDSASRSADFRVHSRGFSGGDAGSGGVSRLAVVGPLANSTGYLLGTYRGSICATVWNATAKQWQQNQCNSANWNDPGCHCVPTVLSSLQKLRAEVTYGGTGVDETNLCNASSGRDPGLTAAAVAAARAADRIVLVLGNSNCVENVSGYCHSSSYPFIYSIHNTCF